MSHFYATAKGNRGEGTRCGTKESGIITYTASWEGAINVTVWYNEELKCDFVRVEKVKWQGKGENVLLYNGPIGALKEGVING